MIIDFAVDCYKISRKNLFGRKPWAAFKETVWNSLFPQAVFRNAEGEFLPSASGGPPPGKGTPALPDKLLTAVPAALPEHNTGTCSFYEGEQRACRRLFLLPPA